MSKPKFTPGPWKSKLAIVSNAPEIFVVTNGKWGAPNIALVDDAANARLIACAPEMCELIKRLTLLAESGGTMDDETEIIEYAKALINRAEGE